jgi:hypothetical protein
MYMMQDAVNPWVWIFFVALVVLGAMFAIQLAIAVLCTHYKIAEEQADDEALQELSGRKLDAGLSRAGEGKGAGKGGQSARSSVPDDLAGAGDQSGLEAGGGAGDVESSGGGGVVAVVQLSGGAAAGAGNGLRAYCFSVQASTWFQRLSIAMVLANTLLLALWWSDMPTVMCGHSAPPTAPCTSTLTASCHTCCSLPSCPCPPPTRTWPPSPPANPHQHLPCPRPPHRYQVHKVGNYVLIVYFTWEVAVKLLGLGFKGFAGDAMNVFDALVVLVGLVDVAMSLVPGGGDKDGLNAQSAIRTLRWGCRAAAGLQGFCWAAGLHVAGCILSPFGTHTASAAPRRLLRMFKLARSWTGLNKLVTVGSRALASVGHLSVILLVLFATFALMGMQLFNYKFDRCSPNAALQMCPPGEECPAHWDCYVPCGADEVGNFPWGAAGCLPAAL